MLWTSLLFVFFLGGQISTASDQQIVEEFLTRYGYYRKPKHNNLVTADGNSPLSDALARFQRFYGIPVTRRIDAQTLHTVQLPRCGLKDIIDFGSGSRYKRHAFMDPRGLRWAHNHLTYRIYKYPKQVLHFPDPSNPYYGLVLSKNDVDRVIQRAFNVWSSVTDLVFTKVQTNEPHIKITFASGYHYCDTPFINGKGGIAHADGPGMGAAVHFDDAQMWAVGSMYGVDLFTAAAHEFGHILGLDHSEHIPDALMFPTLTHKPNPNLLHYDDVLGIQKLYGPKTRIIFRELQPGNAGNSPMSLLSNNISTTVGEFFAVDIPDLCKTGVIDTIFKGPHGDVFVFKGAWYWNIIRENVVTEPRLIAENWPDLPSNIDAAFTLDRNGKTYFFKGSHYWRYEGNKLDDGYPKLISEELRGIPDNVDAALAWSGSGSVYFFKGSQFWRFDTEALIPVESIYPQPISAWVGVPNNLDAVFESTNGRTYFFKKGEYWRFDRLNLRVDQPTTEPGFPRSARHWWFGCNRAVQPTINDVTPNIVGTNHMQGQISFGQIQG